MIFKDKKSKKSIDYASFIINNKLIVHPLWDSITINDEIDWLQDPFENRTWCFYLHSLSPVSYLLHAYDYDNKIVYLEKAKEIISSWSKFNNSDDIGKSVHAWKDHTVANRVVAIIYFWSEYTKTNLYEPEYENELISLLVSHGEFLYDDENYNFRNNHGFFQDRALIEISTIFPHLDDNNEWFNKGKQRMMQYISKFVSNDGVHKEHSSSYHILMLKLISGVNEFFNYHNKNVPELSEITYKMQEYLAYIVKPTGTVPMTGDSGPDVITYLKEKEIDSPQLLYVRTNGEKGEKPKSEIVYKNDGIGIFKDNQSDDKRLYLKFIAAFHSLAHKHADDLSILLTIGNTDFFVDSGKYNYEETDEFRQYFRSSHAHNSITVNRKSYELRSNQKGKSKILNHEINNDYSYLTGVHELYTGVKIERTLIYFKLSESILIHDKIKSNKDNTYSQIFNIGKDVNVEPITKKKIILSSQIDNKVIELLQINHVTEFKNYHGETNPIAGWESTAFNKKHPITQLQFSNKGNDLDYKTVINLDKNRGIKNFTLKTNQEQNLYSITLKDDEKYSFEV